MILHRFPHLLAARPPVALATIYLAMLLPGCRASPQQPQTWHALAGAPYNLSAERRVHMSGSEGDTGCLASGSPSEMLRRVNHLRATGAVCGGVNYPPVAPLRWNTKLQQAAALHSQDMARHNFFDHKSATNGSTLPERLRAVGYKYQSAGENIGAGPSTVAQVIDMWVVSPGHCVTLMTADFVELGASCQNSGHSHHKTYWTLKAATPM